MTGWHYIPAHCMHIEGASWLLWRHTAGLFSPLEFARAVVDDFGNLVRVP